MSLATQLPSLPKPLPSLNLNSNKQNVHEIPKADLKAPIEKAPIEKGSTEIKKQQEIAHTNPNKPTTTRETITRAKAQVKAQANTQADTQDDGEDEDDAQEADAQEADAHEYSDEEVEDTFTVMNTSDPDASFFATFIDGSSFRYLIEYLRLISVEGSFIFTKDYIHYQRADDDKTIMNDVKIKTYKLTDYEFNSSNNEIVATISLSDMRNKTRTVGKKEQMDIYRRAGEPSNFYIQVRSQEKSSGDNPVFYCMPSHCENITIVKMPEYKRGKRDSTCNIYQTDFSKLCKALVANKCTYADFIGYQKGIIIKGYDSRGGIVLIKEFGKCRATKNKSANTKSILAIADTDVIKSTKAQPKLNVLDSDEIETYRVLPFVFKALAKINGFTGPSATINFYIEKNAPMKLVVAIGQYGKLTVLIR